MIELPLGRLAELLAVLLAAPLLVLARDRGRGAAIRRRHCVTRRRTDMPFTDSWLRTRLGAAPVSALALAALVLVTAFLAAALPRAVDRYEDRSLRQAVADAAPRDRGVSLSDDYDTVDDPAGEDKLEPRRPWMRRAGLPQPAEPAAAYCPREDLVKGVVGPAPRPRSPTRSCPAPPTMRRAPTWWRRRASPATSRWSRARCPGPSARVPPLWRSTAWSPRRPHGCCT